MAHAGCASQQTAHRPHPDRARPRRHLHRDLHRLRLSQAGGFRGGDGRSARRL